METLIKDLFKPYNISDVDEKIYTDIILNIWDTVKPSYEKADKAHNVNHIFHVLKRSINMVFWLKSRSRNFNHDKETRYVLKMIAASLFHDVYSYTSRRNHHEKAYELIRKFTDIKVLEFNNHMHVWEKAEQVVKLQKECLESIPGQNGDDNLTKLKWLNKYSKYDLIEISEMVLQHRASYTGSFNNELCEIFSAADRDDLDLKIVINRIYTCSLDDSNKFECDYNGYQDLIINTKNGSAKILPIIKHLEKDGWDNKLIKTFYHLCEKFSRDGYMYKNLKVEGFYKTYYKDQLEDFWNEIDKIIFIPMSMFKYIKK